MTEEPQRAGREPPPDVHLAVQDGLATLTFDRPNSKVNLLTRATMARLSELLTSIEAAAGRGEVRAVLLRSAKRDNFIAGADINELAAMDDAAAATEISRRGQEIFLRLERLPVPTLAAINGACVGGGMELALACDYRLASDHSRARLGLPETQLGILPGLGGTVRLPRLIGLRAALDLILSGRRLAAKRARKIGLVDRVIEAKRFDAEITRVARELAAGKTPIRRHRRSALARLLEDGPPARWLVKRLTRKALLARTKGHYPALPAALEVTVSGLGLPYDRAHEQEAATFGKLAVTSECKNLIAVFQLTEAARKRRPAADSRPVQRAAVVGAGVMGAGIAELFAYQSIPVRIVDIDDDRVRAGVDRARGLLDKAAKRAGWSDDELRKRRECLVGATDYDGFEAVDFVIEAVAENMDIKREVFKRIEERVPAAAVIATNTSALSISELQKSLNRPDRACGLHYFNPPHRMPLVEVVRGSETSDATLATAFGLAVRQGKTPVIVRDAPGFVVNRILAAYLTEAGHLLQAGMSIERVDRAMSRFGMPMGPLQLLDEIGLDVVAEVSRTMESSFGERFAPAPVMKAVLEVGVTGKKGGRGFYRYVDSRRRGVDQEIARLVAEAGGGPPPEPAEAEERMVLSMINEAARALDDEVVEAPENVDVAMIMGAGFPPFRGGLLRYADSLGLERVAERLRRYAADLGPRFAPAPGLLERSAFYSS